MLNVSQEEENNNACAHNRRQTEIATPYIDGKVEPLGEADQ